MWWRGGCWFISLRLLGFVCQTVCVDTLLISGSAINPPVSLTFSPPSVSLLPFSLSPIRLLFSTPPPSTLDFVDEIPYRMQAVPSPVGRCRFRGTPSAAGSKGKHVRYSFLSPFFSPSPPQKRKKNTIRNPLFFLEDPVMMFDWQKEQRIRQTAVCQEGQQEEVTQSGAHTVGHPLHTYTHTYTHARSPTHRH